MCVVVIMRAPEQLARSVACQTERARHFSGRDTRYRSDERLPNAKKPIEGDSTGFSNCSG